MSCDNISPNCKLFKNFGKLFWFARGHIAAEEITVHISSTNLTTISHQVQIHDAAGPFLTISEFFQFILWSNQVSLVDFLTFPAQLFAPSLVFSPTSHPFSWACSQLYQESDHPDSIFCLAPSTKHCFHGKLLLSSLFTSISGLLSALFVSFDFILFLPPHLSITTLCKHHGSGWASVQPSYLFFGVWPKLFWTGSTWLPGPEVLLLDNDSESVSWKHSHGEMGTTERQHSQLIVSLWAPSQGQTSLNTDVRHPNSIKTYPRAV